MSETKRDLWPDAIDVTFTVPPVVILKEQASLLADRTQGIVRGEVESTAEPAEQTDDYLEDTLPADMRVIHAHTFYLVAPALEGYRYALLSVRHDFAPYPCAVSFHPLPEGISTKRTFPYAVTEVKSPGLFVEWLEAALSRNETIRVILALIARVEHAASNTT